MTSKPPIPYEQAIGAFNDSERVGAVRLGAGERILLHTSEPLTHEQALNLKRQWREHMGDTPVFIVAGMDVLVVAAKSDGELHPNAWPRFSIWPFRLRRWALIWTRQNGVRSIGHRFFTRRAAERSAARLSFEMRLPKQGKYPTSPVDVHVLRLRRGGRR